MNITSVNKIDNTTGLVHVSTDRRFGVTDNRWAVDTKLPLQLLTGVQVGDLLGCTGYPYPSKSSVCQRNSRLIKHGRYCGYSRTHKYYKAVKVGNYWAIRNRLY